jgi:hypothetical protein
MIEPVIFNQFKMFGGDTWNLLLTWKDELGNVKDLIGHHARVSMYASKTSDRTTPLILITETSTTPGTITLGNSVPNIICTITDENSNFDTAPPGYLIVEVDDPIGDWQRLTEGKLTYSPSS